MPTIGLFGTCGSSTWRQAFITRYEAEGLAYFNPQVEDWTPELAQIEAEHLNTDEIVLFPILAETSGLGSLAESGFSVMQALKNTGRFIVIFIDPAVGPMDPNVAKESLRARALVRAHLQANPHPSVFVVETLEQMLEVSVLLARSVEWALKARRYVGENHV